MGKRSEVYVERIIDEDPLEVEEVVEYHEVEEIVTERVQLLYPAKVMRVGQVSGKQYVWSSAGVILDVLKEDVPQLLLSHIGARGCCGSSGGNGNKLFQVV